MTFFATLRRVIETGLLAVSFHVARLKYQYLSATFAGALLGALIWFTCIAPPAYFPANHILTVEEGSSIQGIAQDLYEAGVVRSPVLLSAVLRITKATPKSGKYVFARPAGLFTVATRLALGIHGIEATRVRFVEGMTARDMGRLLKKTFPDFDEEGFIKQALPLEGYLFPDTYFFYPDATPKEVVTRLYSAYEAHIADIETKLDASPYSRKDIIIMASLLEREARGLEEKRQVAGILWNRISKGMLLQVDAVFGYIHDVPTYHPAFSDLEVDSPYNTYRYKGLPPGPISNPGLNAILAAATPATTSALFYLTGDDGKMHYAKTFEEHKRNRALYLD